jgi:hypothetical protein
MLRFLKNFLAPRSEQDRMYRFLSQATDQVHLEYLQREWDRMTYSQKSEW